MAKQTKTEDQKKDSGAPTPDEARARLAATGRNDACPCGSGKKYKKCHLLADEQAAAPPPEKPDAQELLAGAWRLFEQRRPGAAEKEFKAALALDGSLTDARVGIGMARLAAGNADGAKEELTAVLTSEEPSAEKLKSEGVKDAFNRPDAQPYIRAAHALGCLAYDEDRFEDATKDLARVYAIDEGSVGVEARMIAAKALMRLEKPAEAAALLEPATKVEAGKGRADVGFALALFASGKETEARAAIEAALETNQHYGKTLLGRVRRRVENIAGARPGSVEEALLYTQTYGDVWTDAAKKFLEGVLDSRARAKEEASAPSPGAGGEAGQEAGEEAAPAG
ncbi:MAG TPA: SEC-C metal-binding domain-containing protein [Polyangia bacterium]|nr:SEC-C metal-binding domain-containing protein [Polyangia bacterium]